MKNRNALPVEADGRDDALDGIVHRASYRLLSEEVRDGHKEFLEHILRLIGRKKSKSVDIDGADRSLEAAC